MNTNAPISQVDYITWIRTELLLLATLLLHLATNINLSCILNLKICAKPLNDYKLNSHFMICFKKNSLELREYGIITLQLLY